MDSNHNCIDFHRLFHEDDVQVLKCGTTHVAKNEVDRGFRNEPTDIVLHTGTNDIEKVEPRTVDENIMNNAADTVNRFNCNVSLLPPRSDTPFSNKANTANKWLEQLKRVDGKYAMVKLIPHSNITTDHLHDRKHLNKVSNRGWSGCQLLAADMFRSVRGVEAPDHILRNSIKWYPDIGKGDNYYKFHNR